MTATPTNPPSPPQVLVFAASDPSSGAGIQADLLTLASLGCHPLTALTAVTVQDTVGVQSVHPLAAELVEQQARTILEDMPVVAFKIGVLGSVENVLAVAEIVSDYPEIPLIFDPVLASGAATNCRARKSFRRCARCCCRKRHCSRRMHRKRDDWPKATRTKTSRRSRSAPSA
jgi:hydroxymethylpyrimidine/phosphomethylpyrimidine kinase